MKNYSLLASSNSLAGILACIAEFWYDHPGNILLKKKEDISEWSIYKIQSGRHMEQFRVILLHGRYRFEAKRGN